MSGIRTSAGDVIQKFKSTAHHPQTQDALERFHQTLKNMMRMYCLEQDKDEGVHLLSFAVQESVHDGLGFSPFELVFGHVPHGPLKLLKEAWLIEGTTTDVITQVTNLCHQLLQATDFEFADGSRTHESMV